EFDRVLRPLAHQVKARIKLAALVKVLPHSEEHLPNLRLALARRRADELALRRHVAPAQHLHPKVARDLLKILLALVAREHILGQEEHPYPVLARLRKRDAQFLALTREERVRDFREDSRPVPAV